ncbi:MAG: DUF3332 domain-containing protein [Tannerellaceae bacterium]|nr:DUF3332 domain-containing protein [Tannerellaceae bacterium]
MKKKSLMMILAASMSGSILFSSCIGSFSVFNKVLSWNNTIGDKWTNELVFLVMCIIPVYEISLFLDIAILNTIEFWVGENPISDLGAQTLEGKDGIYTVEKKPDGYNIRKQGDERALAFIFNKEDRSWRIEAAGQSYKLLKYADNKNAEVYLPNGQTIKVELSQAGIQAFRQATSQHSFFATR